MSSAYSNKLRILHECSRITEIVKRANENRAEHFIIFATSFKINNKATWMLDSFYISYDINSTLKSHFLIHGVYHFHRRARSNDKW